MREMLFKELRSPNLRKKDTVLREVFEKDGLVAKTERRCFYFVKEVRAVDNTEELQAWIDSDDCQNPSKRRHFHITKEHNEELGQDRVTCRIAGTFYAIVGKIIYTVAFLHSFKVCFMKAAVAK